MNADRLSMDLPADIARMLARAEADTGRGRDRLVVDALRLFLARGVVPEDLADEEEERAFDAAREALDRGEYVTLKTLLDDLDGHRHPPG